MTQPVSESLLSNEEAYRIFPLRLFVSIGLVLSNWPNKWVPFPNRFSGTCFFSSFGGVNPECTITSVTLIAP